MKPIEIKLLDEFVDMLDMSMSVASCNDFNLAALMPDRTERLEFVKALHEWNGDPEEFDPKRDYKIVHDSLVLGYLWQKAKAELGRSEPNWKLR